MLQEEKRRTKVEEDKHTSVIHEKARVVHNAPPDVSDLHKIAS